MSGRPMLPVAGWIARERDPTDRRAVLIRALRDRNPELFHLYAGMNNSMDQLCATYTDNQLQLIADFLRRTAMASRTATAPSLTRYRHRGGHVSSRIPAL